MYSVLFVCTANICRSPMAMGLMKQKVGLDNKNWKIESAGVWTQDGIPVSDYAAVVLRKRGIEIKDHKSQQVILELVSAFNLILTMEYRHKEAIRIAFPSLASRIYLISEMVNENFEISDPIGLRLQDYDETASELEQIIEEGFPKIQSLSDGNSIDND